MHDYITLVALKAWLNELRRLGKCAISSQKLHYSSVSWTWSKVHTCTSYTSQIAGWRKTTHYDESTFHANADQRHYWRWWPRCRIEANNGLRFIQESTADYLRHDGKEVQLLLETQQDREFDNGNLPHTSGTCNEIFEEQFPWVQALLSLPPPSLPLAVSASAAPLPPLQRISKRIEACIKPRPFSRLLSHYKRIRRQI